MDKKGIPFFPLLLSVLIILTLELGLIHRYQNRISAKHSLHYQECFLHAARLQLETEHLHGSLLHFIHDDYDTVREELEKSLERIHFYLDTPNALFPDNFSYADMKKIKDIFAWCDTLFKQDDKALQDHIPQLVALLEEAIDLEEKLLQSTESLSRDSLASSASLVNRDNFNSLIIILLGLTSLPLLALLWIINNRAIRKIRISEIQFRTVFNGAYHFMGILDRKGIILDVNRSALELVGAEREELLGREMANTPWWNHSQELQDRIEKALLLARKGRTTLLEAHHFDVNGNRIISDVSVKPAADVRGQVTRIIIEGKDITQNRISEEKSLHFKQFLESVINSLAPLVIVTDSGWDVSLANKRARNHFASRTGEIAGKDFFELFPRYLPLEFEMKRKLTAGSVYTGKCAIRERGRDIYEKITVTPLNFGDNRGWVIQIDDVTDAYLVETDRVQKEKMMSVRGLATGMAHEINNPLAGMIQAAEVILNRLNAPDIAANRKAAEKTGIDQDKLRDYMEERNILTMLESIRDSGAKAAEIVENMLNFAENEKPDISSHSLEELMDNALNMASRNYRGKHQFDEIGIERDYAKDLPSVTCERRRIELVLQSILLNGAEAMLSNRRESSPPRFFIRISYQENRRMVRIEIEDNGPGMEQDVKDRVFDPFFTTKQVGRGTGLGLSVAFFVIREGHHGTIDVRSDPGRGTVFTIQLPVRHSFFEMGGQNAN
jgi:PAS domain S-box-containing protein